ncbi:DUF6478 family protein [Nioella nitratireducens]|uniref:DUF6478 family protein n=1 Tax=Nioella nitratireducens TaxID=1287720 RepID=UPI0008FD838B|nr:DUF6478 family protein [Nioella nitratireducens]
MSGFLEKRLLQGSVQRWQALADRAERLPASELEQLDRTARRLRRKLDRFSAAAENAHTVDPAAGIVRPDQCDWAWRPSPWIDRRDPRGIVELASPYHLSDHVTLFHDCAQSEITLRQTRGGWDSAAPYAVALDVLRFDGSFLSLVLSLPPEGISGLTRNHFYSVRCRIKRENPIELYARLNVQHGPNTEQMVRQVEIRDGDGLAEFDLAYSNINEKRVEKVWIDVIFDNPAMNRVELSDLTLTRAPRADL